MPIYSHAEFLGKYSQPEDRGDAPVDIPLAVEGHRPALKGGLTVVWESEMSPALCLPVASILSPMMQVDIHRNGSTVRGQKVEC